MNREKKKKVAAATDQIVSNFVSDFASIFSSLKNNWALIQQNNAAVMKKAEQLIIERTIILGTQNPSYKVEETVRINMSPFTLGTKKPITVKIPSHAYMDALQERSEELDNISKFFGISHHSTSKQNDSGQTVYTDKFRVPMTVVRTRLVEMSDSGSIQRQYCKK